MLILKQKIVTFVFQPNYENLKGETRGSEIHASRDVQKSLQRDDKRNEDNCIKEGATSIKMCIRGM